jgi:mediator of replication checkpoint protein 1
VSKLLQDITTGRLRRKRGAGGFDDLDLSDDESAHARRREAKRREFAKMRRELLVNSDERLGKIAEDPKKVAFLKALEDRDDEDDVNLDLEFHEADPESQSQSQSQPQEIATEAVPNSGDLTLEAEAKPADREPLQPAQADALNRAAPVPERRRKAVNDRRPQTLAEIRESVSFLVEDPVDPYANGDDSDSDAEAHENLDQAAANAFMESLDADDADDDMDDFVVQDEDREEPLGDKSIFKKPNLPASRAPGPLRRTESRGPVVDRLSLMRQSSSSTSGSTASSNGKLAFFTSSSASTSFKVPSLLRRATSNSSFGSSNEKVSATGVTTMTERGSAGSDKEMIRKGAGGQKSSVGYYRNSRAQQRDEAMKKRLAAGNATGAVEKAVKGKKMGGGGVLGGLVKRNSWQ